MITDITNFLNVLKEIGPLGTIALSLIVILQGQRQKENIDNLKENHLHEVKDSIERLENIMKESQTLQTSILNEIKIGIEVIKVKLNNTKR